MTPGEKAVADVFVVGGYSAYFYRLVRKNPGNKLIEFGGAAIVLVFLMALLSRANGLPGWILPSMGVVLLFFCFAALWVAFKRMARALRTKGKPGE